jgi:hypothetical protein
VSRARDTSHLILVMAREPYEPSLEPSEPSLEPTFQPLICSKPSLGSARIPSSLNEPSLEPTRLGSIPPLPGEA